MPRPWPRSTTTVTGQKIVCFPEATGRHRLLNSHNTHSWQAPGIPAGPSAHAGAQKAMRRLSGQVDEWRNLRTNATVDQLLDRHFELAELGMNTLAHYRSLAEKHIRPLIGW